MKRKLLLIALEYQGYHSPRGAALSRRVKQVATGFASNAWDVTVIHRDNTGETGEADFVIKKEPAGIKRIVVKARKKEYDWFDKGIFRRILTFYYLLFKGDRTYKWVSDVLKSYSQFGIETPDLVISFFTPRGTLYLGDFLAKKYSSKFIIDFQDEIDHGNTQVNKYLSHFWTKQIIKNATALVHVSPEWAERDGKILARKIEVIRHAVSCNSQMPVSKKDEDKFVIFYGGSISKENQRLDILQEVLYRFNAPKKLLFIIAGHENTYLYFKETLGDKYDIEYKGWLNETEYKKQISLADCILTIPWSTSGRMVIPSKFYETVMFDKPIWIIGNDTGAFEHLFKEWEHPILKFNDVDFQTTALKKALYGDFSCMFNFNVCNEHVVRENDLYSLYIKLI